jgi:hypothetical protein
MDRVAGFQTDQLVIEGNLLVHILSACALTRLANTTLIRRMITRR